MGPTSSHMPGYGSGRTVLAGVGPAWLLPCAALCRSRCAMTPGVLQLAARGGKAVSSAWVIAGMSLSTTAQTRAMLTLRHWRTKSRLVPLDRPRSPEHLLVSEAVARPFDGAPLDKINWPAQHGARLASGRHQVQEAPRGLAR
jgi:hypothetical protein